MMSPLDINPSTVWAPLRPVVGDGTLGINPSAPYSWWAPPYTVPVDAVGGLRALGPWPDPGGGHQRPSPGLGCGLRANEFCAVLSLLLFRSFFQCARPAWGCRLVGRGLAPKPAWGVVVQCGHPKRARTGWKGLGSNPPSPPAGSPFGGSPSESRGAGPQGRDSRLVAANPLVQAYLHWCHPHGVG